MPVERRGPAVRNSSTEQGGGREMIKAPVEPQDLGRGIYARAKAEAAGTGGVGGPPRPAESAAGPTGRITPCAKRAGERSAGKPPAPFDVAGAGDGLTAGRMRHSQRKQGATAGPGLRSTAPALDPTGGGPTEKGSSDHLAGGLPNHYTPRRIQAGPSRPCGPH